MLVIGVAQIMVPMDVLRYVCASVLISFGLYKLIRRRHPRWVAMRVGFGDLTAWSFLVATAHGAGLMLIPILLNISRTAQAAGTHDHGSPANHSALAGSTAVPADLLALIGIHTLAMFVVMGMIAVVVYERLGVTILKRTWFNVDLLWAGALVGAGIITMLAQCGGVPTPVK